MGLKEKRKEEKVARVLALHNELVKSIFKKIPVLEEEKEIYLPKGMFQLLTDEEFIVLWSLPNIVIRVSDKAADYMEERRLLLGLKREESSGVPVFHLPPSTLSFYSHFSVIPNQVTTFCHQ
jgi:hypothetical protein